MSVIISDDTHAISAEAVRMVIKNAPLMLTIYGSDLAPAIEMVFADGGARDDFYKKLVDAMAA